MQKTPQEIQEGLARPFAAEDIEWRVQNASKEKMRGLAVPYVTNRAIQYRLDEVVGPDNWTNDFTPWHNVSTKEGTKASQLCAISIHFGDKGWITKRDGAEDTDIEPVKGGLSDSMKRAASQWGIGRVLYNMDNVWVDIEQKGKSFVIADKDRPKLDKSYLAMLDKLHLTPAPPIGTQAQLTPVKIKGDPEQAPSQTAAVPTAGQTPPVPEKLEGPMPEEPGEEVKSLPTQEPEYQYVVHAVDIQKGMTGNNTSVQLQDSDGKIVKAFFKGVREELVQGALLKDVLLTVKKQGTVVFNQLERFELLEPTQRAA